MKTVTVVTHVMFVLFFAAIGANGQDCSQEPFHACAAKMKCIESEGWVVVEGEPNGTPCSTTYDGPIDGACSVSPKHGAISVSALCVPTYTIGASVRGLASGTSVELQLSTQSPAAPVAAVTAFANSRVTFPGRYSTGTGYDVSVALQPSGESCVVGSATGRVQTSNITNVSVSCVVPPDITKCDTKGCISEQHLLNNICNYLMNQEEGWVCMVGDMPPVYGGMARTATDQTQLAMNPERQINIASVSKTMTAVGILQQLAAKNIPVTTSIFGYLYPSWQRACAQSSGACSNINLITFQNLLQHKSGFGQAGCVGDDYASLEKMIMNGVSANNIGGSGWGDYANCNFSLMRELMPGLLGPDATATVENAPSPAEASSHLYISYMNNKVFGPAGIPFRNCTPASNGTNALAYPTPAGTTPGQNIGDARLTCGASGWQFGATDIFKVVNSLAASNVLLPSTVRHSMTGGCYGWDCSVRPDCPSPYVCKNGGLWWNGAAVQTYAGILKCDLPVVILVNSAIPAPFSDPIDVVQSAFNNPNVQVPGSPQACQNNAANVVP